MAVDSRGNVFVTGHSVGSYPSGVYDYATVAYSGVGEPLWTNRYSAEQDLVDSRPAAIAVDSNGKVFVTGALVPSSTNFYYDYFTLAYSVTGQRLWTNRYDGPANGDDRARAMAVDSSGNVFVTGASVGTNGYHDYATVVYSGGGAWLWTTRFNGPGAGDGQVKGIALDRGANVFVTGAAVNSGGYYGYFTVAYSSAGLPLWTNSYHGRKSPYYSYPSAIAVDSSGNVFVTGYSRSEINGLYFDYATVKYSSSWLPSLAIRSINHQVVLSWTNAGFDLQSAPAVTGTFTNIPGASSPYTNPMSGREQFFRLRSP